MITRLQYLLRYLKILWLVKDLKTAFWHLVMQAQGPGQLETEIMEDGWLVVA